MALEPILLGKGQEQHYYITTTLVQKEAVTSRCSTKKQF